MGEKRTALEEYVCLASWMSENTAKPDIFHTMQDGAKQSQRWTKIIGFHSVFFEKWSKIDLPLEEKQCYK